MAPRWPGGQVAGCEEPSVLVRIRYGYRDRVVVGVEVVPSAGEVEEEGEEEEEDGAT